MRYTAGFNLQAEWHSANVKGPYGSRFHEKPCYSYNRLAMAHTEVDFTYDEAVRTLGVTPEKLDRLIDEGALPVNSTGAQTLIPRESILRYLA